MDTFYGDKDNPLRIWYRFADTLMVCYDAPYSRGGHFLQRHAQGGKLECLDYVILQRYRLQVI